MYNFVTLKNTPRLWRFDTVHLKNLITGAKMLGFRLTATVSVDDEGWLANGVFSIICLLCCCSVISFLFTY